MHRSKYTPEQIKYIQDELSEHIYYFGYANVGEDNPTSFFEFEEHLPENLAAFNKFRADNANSVIAVTEPGYQPYTLVHNELGVVPMHDEEDIEKLLLPSIDQARKTMEQT